MKKFFVLLLASLLTFLVSPTDAQVKLGLQAGINLADVSVDPLPTGWETSMRTAFMVGGIFNYNFSPILSLQAEPAYIQKGAAVDATTTEDGMNIKFEATYSANYIDVPVLLKASFGNEQVKPFLLAGASVAILLGDVKITIDKATVGGQDVTSQIPSSDKEQTQKGKSTDFVLNFGGGVMIPVAQQVDIFVEGQYNLGLTNVNDEPNDDTKIKTRGIQIKAGALFSL
jgi:opacity protein-like surface antigen